MDSLTDQKYTTKRLTRNDFVKLRRRRTPPSFLKLASMALFMWTMAFCAVLVPVLFVGPVRDRFFAADLFPGHLPKEITQQDISTVESLAKPGDVIIEKNLHFWQWVGLSYVFTGSTWVHAALVDHDGRILTVAGTVSDLPLSAYEDWRSTRIALIRPPYRTEQDAERAIAYARSKLNEPYDPSFRNQDANCTGLVADALQAGGVRVESISRFDHQLYPAVSFLKIPNARVIWLSR